MFKKNGQLLRHPERKTLDTALSQSNYLQKVKIKMAFVLGSGVLHW